MKMINFDIKLDIKIQSTIKCLMSYNLGEI